MAKAKAKATAPPMSMEEKEKIANKLRKKKVDAENKKKAADAATAEEKLANTPLNQQEVAFIARIAPMMNQGRQIAMPSPADITRYAKLLKRKGVK